jgi:hypothetical protein
VSPSETLRRMVERFVSGETDTGLFCVWFEAAFNLDTDKAALSRRELKAFTSLFNEVVHYSPLPEERAVIPNYKDEAEIRAVAEACLQKL